MLTLTKQETFNISLATSNMTNWDNEQKSTTVTTTVTTNAAAATL